MPILPIPVLLGGPYLVSRLFETLADILGVRVLDKGQFNHLYGSAVQAVLAEYTPQSENIPVAVLRHL